MSSSAPSLAILHAAYGWVASYSIMLMLFAAGSAIERANPVERLQSQASLRFNVAYATLYSVLVSLAQPLMATASVSLVGALGGGLVTLQSHGPRALASFVVVLLTIDLLEYLFHRLQHTVPFLWHMHSLHHSARSFNVTVTVRHYWFEALIRGCLLYPIVGVLFKVEPQVVAWTAPVFALGNYFAHLNLRFAPGRLGVWVNNPQYHRLHHSRRSEHFNKNFAQLLPLWDRLFGTIWLPSPEEWPATGLDDDAEPASLGEALAWPWRGRRVKAAPAAHHQTYGINR